MTVEWAAWFVFSIPAAPEVPVELVELLAGAAAPAVMAASSTMANPPWKAAVVCCAKVLPVSPLDQVPPTCVRVYHLRVAATFPTLRPAPLRPFPEASQQGQSGWYGTVSDDPSFCLTVKS